MKTTIAPLLLLLAACNGGEQTDDPCLVSGTICTYAGTGDAMLGKDGIPATESGLYLPQDLTFGPDGQPYILDWNNHRIRTIDADGIVSTIAGTGLLGDGPEGPAASATFNHPTNIAFNQEGMLLIAAWHNSRVEQIDLATGQLSYVAGTGQRGYNGDDISAVEAVLDLPSAVAVDDQDRLWISDQANQQIRMVEDGVIYDIAGQQRVDGYGGDGGPAADAIFHAAVGQEADPSSRIALDGHMVYLADTGNDLIRSLDLDSLVVDTIAGTPPDCDETGTDCVLHSGSTGDGGPAVDATFDYPTDVEVGPDGELYVADTLNSCVRMIDPDGIISTVVGVCGEPGFDGDEGPATAAHLYRPYGVALDELGNLYVSDTYNHVVRVVRP